jgi:hypothetical protein
MSRDGVARLLGEPDEVTPKAGSDWFVYQLTAAGIKQRLGVRFEGNQLKSWVYEERGPGEAAQSASKEPSSETVA